MVSVGWVVDELFVVDELSVVLLLVVEPLEEPPPPVDPLPADPSVGFTGGRPTTIVIVTGADCNCPSEAR